MNPLDVLSVLSSAPGVKSGGGSIPNLNAQEAKSGASLDSSGSSYQLSSGSLGDLVVGGSKNNTLVLIGIAAIALILVFRK